MRPFAHQPADFRESFEISLLAGQQWIDLEERNDVLDKIVETPHFVLECFVASVGPNAATTEVLLHQQKNFAAISVLTDRKAWSHLPADQQCAARREGTVKQPSPSTNPAK